MGKNTFTVTLNSTGQKKSVSINIIDLYVEEIEILDLDEGSDNSGSNDPKGMIHGKEYTLQVKKFTDDKEPKNENIIYWRYKYTADDGSVADFSIDKKGKKITFKADDLDYCGKKITFYAFISDKEQEGKLDVFHHYRFRWFDRGIVESQIEDRKTSPWLIDQGATSLCGIALVGFYLARDNYDVYKSFILNMHTKGESSFTNTKYKITIDSDEHLINYKTSDNSYPEQSSSTLAMDEIDFIFLLSIKDNLNLIWDYDPDNDNVGGFVEGGTGLTLPNEVEKMFKKINGYSSIVDDTNLITSKWSSAPNSVKKLKSLLSEKCKLAILIEGSSFQNNSKATFSVPTHWVGLLDIIDNSKQKEVEVTVYTWANKTKKWTISYDVFKDSYYGYISGK